MLLMLVGESLLFRRRVHHPGGKYPRLEILHTAFHDMEADIAQDLEKAVGGATDGVIE